MDDVPAEKEGVQVWTRAFKKRLASHPDPDEFQSEIIAMLLELTPSIVDEKPRAIDKIDEGRGPRKLLEQVFGTATRVKVLEALLTFPHSWFNLGELARVAGVGKASAKRIVDNLLKNNLDLVEESKNEQNATERLVKLSESTLAKELTFFHMKLRGIL